MSRILVVEDNEDALELMKEILEAEGFSIIESRTGEEALEILTQEPSIKLAFVDLKLLNIDGWDVMKHIKEHHPTISAVAISAFNYDGIEDECQTAGFVSYISKPIDFKRMKEIGRLARIILKM